jgi:hypothetical protein
VNYTDLQQEKRRSMMTMTSGTIMMRIFVVKSGLFETSQSTQKAFGGRVVSGKGMMKDANIPSIKPLGI